MRAYVDTSAMVKLIKEEPGSTALLAWLQDERPELVSSRLLWTELHRVALYYGVPRPEVETLLARVGQLQLTEPVLLAAERVPAPPGRALGTLDALHLVSAQRLDLTTVLTYDSQLTEAATFHGLDVVAPV